MGLGGAASCFLGGRPRGTAAVCALALAMTLAQLVASWAWASGAHVTVEQVTLHEEGVAHGHAYHHGSLAHGHGYHHANYQASPETLGPVLAPASDHSGLYQDVLHGALAGWPDLLAALTRRSVGHVTTSSYSSTGQAYPPNELVFDYLLTDFREHIF